MEVVFQTTAYDLPTLVEQVSWALEQRTDRRSREKFPKLWAFVDGAARCRVSEKRLRRRRIRAKVYGILLLGMGGFLLLPGLMAPAELPIPLGAGIIGVSAGVGALWSGRRGRASRFDRGAQRLLAGLQGLSPTQIRVDAESVTVAQGERIPCCQIEWVMETADLLVLFWAQQVLVLQKADLVSGTAAECVQLLSAHLPPERLCREAETERKTE